MEEPGSANRGWRLIAQKILEKWRTTWKPTATRSHGSQTKRCESRWTHPRPYFTRQLEKAYGSTRQSNGIHQVWKALYARNSSRFSPNRISHTMLFSEMDRSCACQISRTSERLWRP